MTGPGQGMPSVTVQLVDNGDGSHGIAVNIGNTADLLLVMGMLSQAQTSVCCRASEVAVAERLMPMEDPQARRPQLVVIPDHRILRG